MVPSLHHLQCLHLFGDQTSPSAAALTPGMWMTYNRPAPVPGLWRRLSAPQSIIVPPAVDLRDALTSPVHNAALGTNYNPAFTWKKVDTATYYRLYLAGPGGVVKDQWYQASTICNATTCSVTDLTVGGGTHTWYVLTYNAAGSGPWSLATTFSTTPPTIPAAVDLRDALTAPTHGQNLGTNYNPTFTWKKVNTASWYRLYVAGPAGVVLDQWYQASSICNAISCSVPSPTLGGGTHTWYVLTYNAAGVGPWSLATNFSTTPPTAPAAAILTHQLAQSQAIPRPTSGAGSTWQPGIAYM